jgi:hypothetical protein
MAKAQKKTVIVNDQQPTADAIPAKIAFKGTKAQRIIKLLQRKNGASISDMQKATGWQVHSVHGFLSGTVKKRMGLPLESEVTDKGERRYLVTGA